MSEKNGWSGSTASMAAVGTAAERTRKVGMRDIELFTELTGDRNPLHYDLDAAKASMFGGLIVQGGVKSGLLNAVVAEDLPGPGAVFHGMELKFSKAVYVNDTITARVELTSVREDKPISTLNVSVRNQKGDGCLRGIATTYTAPMEKS